MTATAHLSLLTKINALAMKKHFKRWVMLLSLLCWQCYHQWFIVQAEGFGNEKGVGTRSRVDRVLMVAITVADIWAGGAVKGVWKKARREWRCPERLWRRVSEPRDRRRTSTYTHLFGSAPQCLLYSIKGLWGASQHWGTTRREYLGNLTTVTFKIDSREFNL